jgi:predicted nuclease with TOPRIM domain
VDATAKKKKGKRLFQDVDTIERNASASSGELGRLRGEIAGLREENSGLRAQSAWLRGENTRLLDENADLRSGVVAGGGPEVLDLTGEEIMMPTTGKRSGLSFVVAERQRGIGELTRVKLESKDAKGKLEDAQELADDLYRSEDAKMSEIDTLKAHIKELEMERGYVYK